MSFPGEEEFAESKILFILDYPALVRGIKAKGVIMEEFMLPCLNKQLFGLDCMGCGAQRALLLIFQGQFMAALKLYPAIYSILLLLIFLILNLFIKFRRDWLIRVILIVLNGFIIVGAYLYKISFLFN